MDEEFADRTEILPPHHRRGPRRSDKPNPVEVDAKAGAVTASFQIRYVHGPEADRIAAHQARAILNLLRWLNSPDAAPAARPAEEVDLDAWARDSGQEKAA